MQKIVILILIVLLTGCAAKSTQPSKASNTVGSVKAYDQRSVVTTLKSQYKEWESVRHRMGGLSKRGVDCSGFVYIVFRDGFGIEIPRTTALQSQMGVSIKQEALRPGDLVFFKTSKKVRHVGIYIGKGKFIHASTSKGVMTSHLKNVYWSQKYWQARRISIR